MEFDDLSSNEVTFNLKDLGVNHHMVNVRVNAFAQCSSSLIVTVDSNVVDFGMIISEGVFESGMIPHTGNTLSIKIKFGAVGQGCAKLIQDMTIYVKQCLPHCMTCPDGGNYLEYGTTKCIAACPEGYYLNPQMISCYKCSQSCVDCEGAAENCTKCGIIDGKSFFLNDTNLTDITTGGVCVQDCTGPFYENTQDYTCSKCSQGCQLCQTSPSNCSSCWYEKSKHFYLQPNDNKCLITCPAQYFKFSDHTCAKCTNSKFGHWNQLSAASSVEACNTNCVSGCVQCFGPTLNDCTQCNSNYFLKESTTICSQYCPSGYTQNTVTWSCEPSRFCHSSCKVGSCSITSDPNSCTACESVALPELNYGSFLVKGQCIPNIEDTEVPNLQLLYSINKNSTLGSSYLKSVTVDEATEYSVTNTAVSGLIYNSVELINFDLFSSSSLLKFDFADLGYKHHAVYARLNAYSSCSVTDGTTLEISIDGVLQKQLDISSSVTLVQTGLVSHIINTLTLQVKFGVHNTGCSKFVQDITMYIKRCQPYCGTCPDGGALLQYGSTVCLATCPDGDFVNSLSTQCERCDKNCSTCSTIMNQCTSCGIMTGKYYFLDTVNKICVEICPDGYFQDFTDYKCNPCNDGCVTCETTASNCSQCTIKASKIYYKQPGQNQCLQNSCPVQYAKSKAYTCVKCTNGKFGDGVGGTTDECQINCEDGCGTCFGTGLDKCFSCQESKVTAGKYFYLQPEAGSTVCSEACPLGQYGDKSTFTCRACNYLCKTCVDSATKCTSCDVVDGVVLALNLTGNTCISSCPTGSYKNQTQNKCVMCDEGCSQCYGSGLEKCTKCTKDSSNIPFHNDPILDKCVKDCDPGQYQYSTNFQCLYCYKTCKTCETTSIDCTSCKNDSSIVYYLFNPNNENLCLMNCPKGYYGDPSLNLCQLCDSRCAQCSASGNSSCTQCKPANGVNHFLIYGNTHCSDLCADGTYPNITSFKCLLCDSNCKKCINNSTTCTSCGLTDTGLQLFLQNHQCVQTCLKGFYAETINNTCTKCTAGCDTCTYSGLNNCQSCTSVTTVTVNADSSTTTTLTTFYKHIGADTCATTCPAGQFIDANILYLCQACSSECTACQDSAKKCLNAASCATNFFFLDSNSSCLTVCPDGFYANTTTKKCTQCHPGCSLCTGGSLTACTACKTDSTTDPANPQTYFKKIGQSVCTLVCDAGQYEDPVDNLCKYCENGCSECLDKATNCTSCKNVSNVAYFLYNSNGENQCLQVCPQGYFGDQLNNKCTVCDSRCVVCTGATNISCSVCKSITVNSVMVPHYLIWSTTICSDTCPDGQYGNLTSKKCLLCSQNCKTCVINSTNCLSCGQTVDGIEIYLDVNKCVQICPKGFYSDLASKQCKKCNDGCAECFGPTLTDCTECRTFNSVVYYKYVGFDTCETTCPLGQYIDSSKSNMCASCDSSCVGCNQVATNCTVSSGCNAGTFYFAGNSSCLNTCPLNYFPDLTVTTASCTKCDPGCLECSGSGLSKCTKCEHITNGTNYYKNADATECTQNCPDGFYEYDLTLTCEKCHPSCITCETGPFDCRKCNNASGITYYFLNNECLEFCPNTYYGDQLTNQCKKCDSRCQLCFASGNASCTSCQKDSSNLNHFLVYGTTKCSDTCPEGSYPNATSFKCHLCDPNCKTCIDDSTKCISCGLNNFGLQLFLQNNLCVQTCLKGFYQNTLSSVCSKCSDACAVCTDSGLNSCQTCQNITTSSTDANTGLTVTTKTPYYKHIGADTCATTCPAGQFIDANILYLCQACSSECTACQDSAKKCLNAASCATNFFFLDSNSSCLTVCPDGFYANTTTKKCTQCHPGCSLCTGGSLTACTACKTDSTTDPANPQTYFKKIGQSVCTLVCDAGQYEDPVDNLCKYCNSSCGQCLDGSRNCTSCKNVTGVIFYLFDTNGQNECVETCPAGYFGDKSNNKCVACDERCSACTGATNLECSSCKKNSTNISSYLIYGSTTCSSSCPPGQFKDDASLKCSLCDMNCKTCVDALWKCTSCSFDQLGQSLFLQNTFCVQDCKAGFYEEIDKNTCVACHPGCLTCTESELTDCQSCGNVTISGQIKLYYKDLFSTTCGLTCPTGQYIDSGVPNVCQLCSGECISCVENRNKCLNSGSCASTFFYFSVNSSCLSTCPDGYYADILTRQCTLCHGGCEICTGPGTQACLKCRVDTSQIPAVTYYKEASGPVCSTSCGDGYYKRLLSFTCEPCDSACLVCTSAPDDCQLCRNSSGIIYFNYGNKCYANCSDGYYGDPLDNKCKPCHEGCALCSTASNKTCSACRNVSSTGLIYYLEFGTTYCSLTCKDGEYKIPELNQCGKCNINCNTCTGTATNCTSCYLSSTGTKSYLQGTICVQICNGGLYANDNSRKCEPCHEGCATCFGPNLYQCYTCKKSNNGLINYYKFINQTICGQNICPLGQYISVNFTANCQECSPQCNACINRAGNCVENLNCTGGYFYFAPKNSCLSTCPNGYWAKLFSGATYGVCQLCESGCLLCTGPTLLQCQKCTSYNGVNYYKKILTDECSLNCPDGEYEVGMDLSCKPCHPSCVVCNTSAYDCQKCQNVSTDVYYFHNNECLLKCPDGFWPNPTANQCQPCHTACPTCFGPSITQCYNCRKVASTNYYLVLGTHVCDLECPSDQFEQNLTNSCKLCSQNCFTCDLSASNCTRCSSLSTGEILYFFNYKCLSQCPEGYWKNSTFTNNHYCTICRPSCSSCTGPSNHECMSCKNITTVNLSTGRSSTIVYYKDMLSTTCGTGCPPKQYVSVYYLNDCQPCDTVCQLCERSSIHCSKCIIGYYLHQEMSSCLIQCPEGFFNDNTLTPNNYLCAKCTPGCKTCTASGLNNCPICTNVFLPDGSLVRYFKHQQLNQCSTTCELGYFGNFSTNLCDACHEGCVSCQYNATYCYQCRKVTEINYYLTMNSNQCLKVCPDGTYGDPITLKCVECIYYSYQSNCLLSCPNDTSVNTITGKSFCENCSTIEGTCKPQYQFVLSTKLINEGKSLEHKINLPAGLLDTVKPEDLKTDLKVYLVLEDSRLRRRLLVQTIELNVEDLRISPTRNYIIIQSNSIGKQIDFVKTKVQVIFRGGVLISRDGVGYISTTDLFQLSDPIFIQSYFLIYELDYGYMAEGIILSSVLFVFLLVTVAIMTRKAYHEVMAFVMLIETIGLMRIKEYPIELNMYTVLQGFSCYEFNFIPNFLLQLYPKTYEEISLQSVEFALGNHNFINSMGSSFQLFVVLQMSLLGYYIWNKDKQGRVAKCEFMQDALMTLFFVKTIYSTFLSLYSFSINTFTSMPDQFLTSQIIAGVFLVGYLIYIFIWVCPATPYELYKIHNLFRVALVLLAVQYKTYALISLNVLEVIVFMLDFGLYRKQKLNKHLYVIDKVLSLAAINSAAFLEDPFKLQVALALTLYSVFFIKGYYLITAYIQHHDNKTKKGITLLSISDFVSTLKDHTSELMDDYDYLHEKYHQLGKDQKDSHQQDQNNLKSEDQKDFKYQDQKNYKQRNGKNKNHDQNDCIKDGKNSFKALTKYQKSNSLISAVKLNETANLIFKEEGDPEYQNEDMTVIVPSEQASESAIISQANQSNIYHHKQDKSNLQQSSSSDQSIPQEIQQQKENSNELNFQIPVQQVYQMILFMEPEDITLQNYDSSPKFEPRPQTQNNTREKQWSPSKTDLGFYPKRNRNIKRGKMQIGNQVQNLIEDVEVIKIDHHSDQQDHDLQIQSHISEGGWMDPNDETLKEKERKNLILWKDVQNENKKNEKPRSEDEDQDIQIIDF